VKKDFLAISDLSIYDFNRLLEMAGHMKAKPRRWRNALGGKVLAMIFEKPSLRTRMTFEVGMLQLGGEAVYLSPFDIQLGKRESTADVGHNLERWVDGIMIRTFGHHTAVELAGAVRIPVINALTDLLHPCQAMADFMTLQEKKGDLAALKLAYVGDGNNVCHSLINASAKAGTKMAVATPRGYEPSAEIVVRARDDGRSTGFAVELSHNPVEAVSGADAVYTDVWASMGQEKEKDRRRRIFARYQVNARLMAAAKPGAFFMHCLPAHRGEEVSDQVLDSPASIVFDQAENRLHVQKAIMVSLMGKRS
jgi:ornithine carbamoyltransferase